MERVMRAKGLNVVKTMHWECPLLLHQHQKAAGRVRDVPLPFVFEKIEICIICKKENNT